MAKWWERRLKLPIRRNTGQVQPHPRSTRLVGIFDRKIRIEGER
jgi:hypothetical protein